MAQKQQTLINCLNKLIRQNFLYRDESGKDKVRVRLRNDLHRVEQVSEEENKEKLRQRLANDSFKVLPPVERPYSPVAGWPVLNLDDLVLSTLSSQLDPEVWKMLRSQMDKTEIKRAIEKKTYREILNDFSFIHECPASGFDHVKVHLEESEARIQSVKAGFSHSQHFLRMLAERTRRVADPDDCVKQFSTDPYFVSALERVRKDMVLFLTTLKDLLGKVLLVKVKHLKSHTPINLNQLGNEKNTPRAHTAPPTVTTGAPPPTTTTGPTPPPTTTTTTGACTTSENWVPKFYARPGKYAHGIAPVQHCFKTQILSERPPHWPMKPGYTRGQSQGKGVWGSMPSFSAAPQAPEGSSLGNAKEKKGIGLSKRPSLLTSDSRDDISGLTTVPFGSPDREMIEKFRKIWPPVWMSLAAMEQGSYIVDPACPSKEYSHCLGMHPTTVRSRHSLSDILETRQEWAEMRKQVSKTVVENLWREDKEKLSAYRMELEALAHVPLGQPFEFHQQHLTNMLIKQRQERQKKVIFDCEVSEWYKRLVERVHEDVGEDDVEIDAHLEAIKCFFNMSATLPRLGKAKLALIVMSMPAYVVCQVHVQRAVHFILTKVMAAQEALFLGWLATRGLPLVIVDSHKF